MTTYYYRGVNTKILNKITEKLQDRLGDGSTEITLKNGAEIEIYGTAEDALLVDDEDREYRIHDAYELAWRINEIAHRNIF